MTDTPNPPTGYCECGCGRRTAIAKRNFYDRNIMKGQPQRYLRGHGGRVQRTYVDRAIGYIEESKLSDELSSTEELWLPVVGFEGSYEVSNKGRVRSVARRVPDTRHPDCTRLVVGKVLSLDYDRNGYTHASLSTNGQPRRYSVHRLVCAAFHGGSENPAMQVRHLNAIRDDNRPENLAWGTPAENNMDTIVLGRHPGLRRTHCKDGHRFSVENTYVSAAGQRICRTCHRTYQRNLHRRKVARLKAESGA